MTGMSSFHDLTITVRVEVTDPAAVLSDPSASHFYVGADGQVAVYLPGSVEEAVIARFTALLDQMYQPCGGLVVCEHSEQLDQWRRRRPPESPDDGS